MHDGRIGIANQVIGRTEAIGLPFVEKTCTPRFPWSRLPPSLWSGPGRGLSAHSDPMAPPWPDLLITAGRGCAAVAIAVKRASGGRSFLVQIQDPRMGRQDFDLMVVPAHDPARGDKVVVTRGAVHRVTPERLAAAAGRFAASFAHLPHPRVAVLIGGQNRGYRLGIDRLGALADPLPGPATPPCAGPLGAPSPRPGQRGRPPLRARRRRRSPPARGVAP